MRAAESWHRRRVSDVLELLLGAPPAIDFDDLDGWLERLGEIETAWSRPIDRALAGGFAADRLGYAFVAGYRAALAALVPDLDPPAALCVTEAGGNHPRAIETRLEQTETGWRVSGAKSFVTLADRAAILLVAASAGDAGDGRKQIRLVRVSSTAAGASITPNPATPFAPEVPHGRLTLDGVVVGLDAVVAGDGYELIKAFRTVEDIHVHAAATAYLIGVARRCGWPAEPIERLVAHVLTLRSLADAAPLSSATHIALAGALAAGAELIDAIEPRWDRVEHGERERWRRDLPLFRVASKAREARRTRAWEHV